MTFNDRFSKLATQYAKYRPSYPDSLFEFLAKNSQQHDLAWDVATGSGQAAIKVAPHFKKVFASDASRSQIRNAFPNPKIEYSVSPAESSPLQSESVDLITTANGLHWFNQEVFFVEAKRVLKNAGVIAAWCYHEFQSTTKLPALIQKYEREIIGDFWADEVKRWVWTHYQDMSFPFEPIAAPSFSMSLEWNCEALLGYLSSWSATHRYLEMKGENPIELIREEVKALFSENHDQIECIYKIHLKVGRKT